MEPTTTLDAWSHVSPMVVTLWPAIVLMAYFLGAMAIFATRSRMKSMPIDAEVLGRPDSPVLSRFLRHYIMWLLAPWQRLVVRTGLTPNMLTFASLLAALGAGVAAATGSFAAAGWLYFLCGILDILDGRVARIRNLVSQSGAFFDSVIDRYAEMFVFGGMAIYYRSSWALVGVLLASLGSVMVSYTRARGEALGVSDLNIGLMQRPERLFYLGMSMILSPMVSPLVDAVVGPNVLPPHVLVVAGILLLVVSTNLTAVRRIIHTMDRLDGKVASKPTRPAVVSVPAISSVPSVTASNMVPLRAAGGRS